MSLVLSKLTYWFFSTVDFDAENKADTDTGLLTHLYDL